MADNTAIEWTDATWTPIRARRIELQDDGSGRERIGWHCEHASPGCVNCYAEGFNKRLGTGREFKPAHLIHVTTHGDRRGDVSMFLDEKLLLQPLKWKRPRMVFVCSMTDLFAGFVRDEWIDKVFAVMALAPRHTFQVLTKRADRMASYLSNPDARNRIIGRAWEMLGRLPKYKHEGILQRPWPLPNAWVGVSVEDQARADDRRTALSLTAARGWLTWVSYEPALTRVDWTHWQFIRWLVAGGESGRLARPAHPSWFRDARDFCAKHGIAFNFKQQGAWAPGNGGPGGYLFARDRTKVRSGFFTYADAWHEGQPNLFRQTMDFIGKKAAGRLLDGAEHNGFPLPQPTEKD